MIIPKEIKVGKTKYTIEWFESICKGRLICRGFVSYITKVIGLSRGYSKRRYSSKQISETFWHEVTHAILYDMKNDLYKDEKFVTEFSKSLNNAILSAKL